MKNITPYAKLVNETVSIQVEACLDYLTRCPGRVCENFEYWLEGKDFAPDMEAKFRGGVKQGLKEHAA